MSEETKQVVERYLTEVLAGGGETDPAVLISSAELRQRVARFRTAFPDLEVEAGHVLAADGLVAVHLVGRATHQGLFQGAPPTGRSWEATCTAIYHVAGGRIADAWVNWDLLTLMEQLGAVERAQTVSA